MYDIICYDTRNMRRINRLYQWDRNFSITIDGVPTSPLPMIQYANRNRRIAIDAIPEVKDGRLVSVIPDGLLEEAEPLFIYIYLCDKSNSKKVIAATHIPVRPRMKPSDDSFPFIYTHYVTFMSEDGSYKYGEILVEHGRDAYDPVDAGVFDVPTKDYFVDWYRQFITRIDYTFDGWSEEPYGEVSDAAFENITEDKTLYAHFDKKETLCAVPYPDLNHNGVIDLDDASTILQVAANISAGEEPGVGTTELIMADINCDDVVTAIDAQAVLEFIALSEEGEYTNDPRGWNEYMRYKFRGEDFYTVELYNGSELVLTMLNILRNDTLVYPLDAPVPNDVADPDAYEFSGWYPEPAHVFSDMVCVATYKKRTEDEE